MNEKLDLSRDNISRPVPLDVKLPAGAQIQKICVSDHYVVLDQAAGTAYSTGMIANILEHLLSGGTSRIMDAALTGWLINTGAARKPYNGTSTALVLDNRDTARSMADILRHPERYD